jgi:spermidine/putrescine transport system permease protein
VRRVGPVALAAPAVGGMLVFFVAPLVTFAVYSFLTAGLYSVSRPWTLDAYRDLLTTPVHETLALNSLVIGLSTATVTVLVGLPIAYWLRYLAGRLRYPVLFVLTATMFASYLVRIYAWRTLLGSDGIVNSALERVGLVEDSLSFLVFSRFAVTIALTHIFLPIVVLSLYAGLRPLEPAYLELAQDLGAGPVRRWWKVILPALATPITTSFFFVFALAAADWVSSAFLGGISGQLFGLQIALTFRESADYALGAAMSLATLASLGACFLVVRLGLRVARLDRLAWVT